MFPVFWTDAIQEFLSGLHYGVQLVRPTTTSLRLLATAAEPVAIGIGGRWRYATADVTATHPGGAAGVYKVFVTAHNESLSNSPLPNTDNTDYSLGLVITATTPGGVDSYRQIGTCTWDGSKITSEHVFIGTDSTSDYRNKNEAFGVRADRPQASWVPGLTWHSTDTGDTSYSDGTDWFTLTPAACSFLYLLSQASYTTPNNVGSSGEEVIDVGSNGGGGAGAYVFTAPVKGTYRLDVYIPSGWATVKKNGSADVVLLTGPEGKGLAVQLNGGDTLGLKVTSGTVTAGAVFMVQLAAQRP